VSVINFHRAVAAQCPSQGRRCATPTQCSEPAGCMMTRRHGRPAINFDQCTATGQQCYYSLDSANEIRCRYCGAQPTKLTTDELDEKVIDRDSAWTEFKAIEAAKSMRRGREWRQRLAARMCIAVFVVSMAFVIFA